MRQDDRVIDWGRDTHEVIERKINAADSAPGVLDTLFGQPYYLYGAHNEDQLRGAPGQLLAQRDGAVCVATIDGAIWISHLRQKDDSEGRGIKLPATMALGMRASRLPHSAVPVDTKTNHRTFREIRYDEEDGVGYLSFDFYNGAMSTGQCNRLRNAFLFARLLQALRRENRNLPIGNYVSEDGSRRKLGSRISEAAGQGGGNFLTPEIAHTTRRETAYREIGAMIAAERLATNLLSSMPLNLLAPWGHTLERASGARLNMRQARPARPGSSG